MADLEALKASEENFEAFKEAEGYERCALPTGIGARIAAEIIIESMKKKRMLNSFIQKLTANG